MSVAAARPHCQIRVSNDLNVPTIKSCINLHFDTFSHTTFGRGMPRPYMKSKLSRLHNVSRGCRGRAGSVWAIWFRSTVRPHCQIRSAETTEAFQTSTQTKKSKQQIHAFCTK